MRTVNGTISQFGQFLTANGYGKDSLITHSS